MSWLEHHHAPFSWSHSRAVLFEECRRKYYWRYYAPFGLNAPWEAGDRLQLYLLGKLTNMPMLVGSIVHTIAHEALEGARKGKAWEAETYAASAQVLLSQAMRASARTREKGWAHFKKGSAPLEEHFYRLPFGEQEEAQALERVAFYARGLYEHFLFQDALAHPAEIVAVERFDRYSVLGVPVYAVPDLIQREDAVRLRLVDWKTGTSVEEKREVYKAQLAIYALYAQKKWALSARELDCRIAEILTGAAIAVPLTDEDLKQTEGRIAASILEMQSLLRDLERNLAHRDDYAMLASPETPVEALPMPCRRCPYRLPCYGERGSAS